MSVERILFLLENSHVDGWYFSGYQMSSIMMECSKSGITCLEEVVGHLLSGYKLSQVCINKTHEIIFEFVVDDEDPDRVCVKDVLYREDLKRLLNWAIDCNIYPYDQAERTFDPERYGLKRDFPKEDMIGQHPPDHKPISRPV